MCFDKANKSSNGRDGALKVPTRSHVESAVRREMPEVLYWNTSLTRNNVQITNFVENYKGVKMSYVSF